VRVSLFITCIVDQLFPNVGVSMVRLLRRYGCDVDFPASQTCCGQPPFNSGYVKEARTIAANHLRAFADSEYIVSPSGSCTGMVHHYYSELFADDPVLAEKAAKLAERSYEFSSFLVNVLGVTDVGAVCPHTVTFHPSCHASRLLGVRDEPMTLLYNVRDIKLVPLPYATDCCGFGGTFSVKMSDVSGAMVSEKVDHVAETGAEYLVGTDMGCLINIGGHMKRRGMSTKVMHLAEFLETFSRDRSPTSRDRSEPAVSPR
jgi:L-lactate dehydrogenase complex protein LldE